MRPQQTEVRRIRIAIADNHPVFREGIHRLLESEPDFTIVGEAEDGLQALRVTLEQDPDILLLDASMPRMSGIETLQKLANTHRNTRIILVTAGIENSALVSSIRLGIRGIVLKQSPTQELCEAIRAVMAGHHWMYSESVPSLAEALGTCFLMPRERYKLQSDFSLTFRELEIVSFVLSGKSNKDIGLDLSISEQTVKHHLTSIYRKVGLSNRLQLMLLVNSLRNTKPL